MKFSEEEKLVIFGIAIYLASAFLVFFLNPELGGARSDSSFYFNMFSAANPRNISITLDNYQVATSPIYIFLIGSLHAILGSYFSLALHVLYVSFAIASIAIFGKILGTTNWLTFAPIMSLFAGSGYFVAPSIWPTSDTPSIFFALLCLYSFLKKKRAFLTISAFLLISTRQSFAWLLCAFFFFECLTNKRNWTNYLRHALKFIPSFGSFIVTLIFFDGHLTPPLYETVNSSNVFKIPNFLTSVQIGLCLFSILFPFIFSYFPTYGIKYISSNYLVLVMMISTFPIIYNFYGRKKSIGDGLGWISILFSRFNLSILIVCIIASLGIAILLLYSANLDRELKLLFNTMFVILLVFSLAMPVPFLRYFEVSLIFICALILGTHLNNSKRLGFLGSILLSVFVASINFAKIIG